MQDYILLQLASGHPPPLYLPSSRHLCIQSSSYPSPHALLHNTFLNKTASIAEISTAEYNPLPRSRFRVLHSPPFRTWGRPGWTLVQDKSPRLFFFLESSVGRGHGPFVKLTHLTSPKPTQLAKDQEIPSAAARSYCLVIIRSKQNQFGNLFASDSSPQASEALLVGGKAISCSHWDAD